jgi:hypothetical protein
MKRLIVIALTTGCAAQKHWAVTPPVEVNGKNGNRKLGQENDPDYLAYAVVYVIDQAGTL